MKNLKQGLKRGLVTAILLLSTILIVGQGDQKNNELANNKLTIDGILRADDQLVKNERVLVYLEDKVVGTAYSNDIGIFQLALDFDKTYYLVFGSEKYDMKWIKVGTNIPLDDRQDYHMVNLMINMTPIGEPSNANTEEIAQK